MSGYRKSVREPPSMKKAPAGGALFTFFIRPCHPGFSRGKKNNLLLLTTGSSPRLHPTSRIIYPGTRGRSLLTKTFQVRLKPAPPGFHIQDRLFKMASQHPGHF